MINSFILGRIHECGVTHFPAQSFLFTHVTWRFTSPPYIGKKDGVFFMEGVQAFTSLYYCSPTKWDRMSNEDVYEGRYGWKQYCSVMTEGMNEMWFIEVVMGMWPLIWSLWWRKRNLVSIMASEVNIYSYFAYCLLLPICIFYNYCRVTLKVSIPH